MFSARCAACGSPSTQSLWSTVLVQPSADLPPHTRKDTLEQSGSVGVRWLIPTLSQSSRSRSTRILISSGMAKEGWVSLSWMATCQGRVASQDGFQTKYIGNAPCFVRIPRRPVEVLWLSWDHIGSWSGVPGA